MSKGFVWFCQNNDTTDYTKLSHELAGSIKRHNKHNQICVITDQKSVFKSEHVDEIRVLKHDAAAGHAKKFANEYKIFDLSPFTHTIKLEADILWNSQTDWWWHYLCQHDLVFSVDCFDYKENRVKDKKYRPFHAVNFLPNLYNGMTYFRKSERARRFFDHCKSVADNWKHVKQNILRRCFDDMPTTDIVYALAYRNMDPCLENLIDYPWFKFIHNKPAIHDKRTAEDPMNYYYPMCIDGNIFFGGKRIMAPLHYHSKDFLERINVRTV